MFRCILKGSWTFRKRIGEAEWLPRRAIAQFICFLAAFDDVQSVLFANGLREDRRVGVRENDFNMNDTCILTL